MARMLFVVGLGAVIACSERPPGLRWVVPEEYEGCITVRFHVKGAPPLPMDQGWYLITPDQVRDGMLLTSTEPQWGERLQREVYVQTSTGRRIGKPSCTLGGTRTYLIDDTVEVFSCFGPSMSKQDCLQLIEGDVR